MSSIGDKHVVPRAEQWGVKTAGGLRASRKFSSRDEAIQYAKETASKHNVCMVVHDDTGKFKNFDCDPSIKNQHVVKKEGAWGVVEAGSGSITKLFDSKGAAMAYAYDNATRNNVCMLVHDKEGKFKSVTCTPDGTPGILDVFRMKLKI